MYKINLSKLKVLIELQAFFPVIIFLVIISAFSDSIPYLDGNIQFLMVHDFYKGGFENLFINWNSIHPPFKQLLVSLFFFVFGKNSLSYSFGGLVVGIIGILYFYRFSKIIVDKKFAIYSTILIALHPLYLSNSIYMLADFLLTVIMIACLYYYVKGNFLLVALLGSFAVLTKETGILLPLSIIGVELMSLIFRVTIHPKTKQSAIKWTNLALSLIPILTAAIWIYFLHSQGKGVWSDWNFSSVSHKGSVYTVIHNVFTLGIFNKYAYQQWLHLFVLNFNWLITTTILIGLIVWVTGKHKLTNFAKLTTRPKTKLITVSFLFTLSYIILVLSFQTYAIPRYSLPVIPFTLIAFTASLSYLTSLTKNPKIVFNYSFLLFIILMGFRLFTSIDPVSLKIWGKTEVLGQKLYGLNHHLAGNDGITYNAQYLLIIKNRTSQILPSSTTRDIEKAPNCNWLFPDPNNDIRTVKILKLKDAEIVKTCLNF